MRKILQIIVYCTFVIALMLSGCSQNTEDAESGISVNSTIADEEVSSNKTAIGVTVEGRIFGGSNDKRIKLNLDYDPKWLTISDNTVYNSDLAKFSSIICADTYFREKDLEKNTQNRVIYEGEKTDEYINTALLTRIGFQDVVYIDGSDKEKYTEDINDLPVMLMGHSSVDDEYEVFIVAVRGCFSLTDWISMFDMGSDKPSYTSLTGAHSEWNDKKIPKGLYISAMRAGTELDEYIKTHSSADRKISVLITGHSRGGAIANILGAQLEADSQIQSYTYTFNSCRVTSDNKAREYKTIFNVCDSNDLFENFCPFGKTEFFRYGNDLQADIASSSEIKKLITDIKGSDDFCSLSADKKAEYIKLFGERFSDRESLYENKNIVTVFEKTEEAESYYAECLKLISPDEGLGIDEYCSLDEITENADGKYEVTLKYCDEALLMGYGKLLAYGNSVYDGFITVFKGDEGGCRIADFINENIQGIAGGHFIVNSYAIADVYRTDLTE